MSQQYLQINVPLDFKYYPYLLQVYLFIRVCFILFIFYVYCLFFLHLIIYLCTFMCSSAYLCLHILIASL